MDKAEEKDIQDKKINPKKKKVPFRLIFCTTAVIVFTIVSLLISLWKAGLQPDGSHDFIYGCKAVGKAITSANIYWILGLLLMVIFSYVLDGLSIFIFARLYTKKYSYGQAFANGMVGAFYSAVTPGGSGGQIMQSYIMKRQGIAISNAASIFVMWFILYQINLILFDIIAIIVEWGRIINLASFAFNIGGVSITCLPLIIIGFVFNIGVLAFLFLMSYSHKVHNFIMVHIVNLGHKLHLIKNPDKTRENLRVQVENFKIELKRLLTNIPVALLISVIFFITLFVRFSLPYFSAQAFLATEPLSFKGFIDTSLLSAFHQMVTGIFPIPGAAGVSEVFYATIFQGIFIPTYDAAGNIIRDISTNISSSQIIWRLLSFHLVVLVGGVISIVLQARPSKHLEHATRQSFVTIQMETYEIRKMDLEHIYETKQLSKAAIKSKLKKTSTPKTSSSTKKLIKKIEKTDKE